MSKFKTKFPFYKNRFYFGLALIFVLVCCMGLLVKAGNDKFKSDLSNKGTIENVGTSTLKASANYTIQTQ